MKACVIFSSDINIFIFSNALVSVFFGDNHNYYDGVIENNLQIPFDADDLEAEVYYKIIKDFIEFC